MRTCQLLLLSLAAFVTISECQFPPCGEREMLVACPNEYESEYCPTKVEKYNLSKISGNCGRPECRCIFNYRRDASGTCIDIRNCPPFECTKPNEEYTPCPPLCPTDSCMYAKYKGKCPTPFLQTFFVVSCSPTCRCKPGYWRDSMDTCVPKEECDLLSNEESNELLL